MMRESSIGLACIVLLACGSGSDARRCGDVDGCGGDLTGKWNVTGLCGDVDPNGLSTLRLPFGVGMSRECPQVDLSPLHTASLQPVDGHIEFTTDGRYVESGAVSLHETYLFTDACIDVLASSSIVQNRPMPSAAEARSHDSCDNVLISGITFSSDTLMCSAEGGTCRCETTQSVAQFDATGSYRTDGDLFFLDGRTKSGAYCVRGDTAALSWPSTGADGIDLKR